MMLPELLSPAGTLRSMRYAFAYGADAVYAGMPRYSLRVRENDFRKPEQFEQALSEARAQGRQFYLAANIAPHNDKVATFIRDIRPIVELGPDALIMSDPGLIMMVRETWPDMPVHLSVQANAVNHATVRFWARQGIERVILSRELSLREIEDIRAECPETEIEVFVHGALCIAYSGRCLLSGYMNHRDSNQGACTNACRWSYQVSDAREDLAGNILATDAMGSQPTLGEGPTTDRIMMLQDPKQPERQLPAFEDEHGTYIMNSKDLRAVQHVHRLTQAGVHSFKIEGRTKSHYYVARTAQVYRRAIDDAVAGREFDMGLMDELEKLSHRGYTEGFYRRHVHDAYQEYENGTSQLGSQQFVGEIADVDRTRQQLVVAVKNRFSEGQTLELMTPDGNIRWQPDSIENRKGERTGVAPGSGHEVRIPMPEGLPDNLEYALLLREGPA
ncbi:tRNA 5-hydroxyuridine modification protein YegQ [Marinobacteraceae bacterium S3BR75-40.1]